MLRIVSTDFDDRVRAAAFGYVRNKVNRFCGNTMVPRCSTRCRDSMAIRSRYRSADETALTRSCSKNDTNGSALPAET